MSRVKENFVCYEWMLEYIAHELWQKFTDGSEIDEGFEDVVNGLMYLHAQDHNIDPIQGKLMGFLSLLVYTIHLKKIINNTEGESDVDEDEFAQIHCMVDNLSHLCSSDLVDDRAVEARKETICLRVFSCCLKEQYEAAQNIFHEHSQLFDKKTTRQVLGCLNSKKRSQSFLDGYRLPACQRYIPCMTKFLKAVYQSFPSQSALSMLAESFLGKSSAYEGARNVYTREEIGEGDREVSPSSSQRSALNKKLDTVRRQKIREAALSLRATRKRESSNSADQDSPAADGDTQTSNESQRSPTKRSRGEDSPPSATQQSAPSATQQAPVLSQDQSQSDPSNFLSIDIDSDATSDSSEEEQNLSLRSRVPHSKPQLKYKQRPSLAPKTRKFKPPSHHKSSVGRVKWTGKEEEELYNAVQILGLGEWAAIRDHMRSSRSNVQLKDKWRNILKTSYHQLKDRFGPVDGVE